MSEDAPATGTPAAKIAPPRLRVELPMQDVDGKPIAAVFQRIPLWLINKKLGQVPGAGPEPSEADLSDRIAQAFERATSQAARELIVASAVSPRFALDDASAGPGEVPATWLSDPAAVVALSAVLRVSGWTGGGAEKASSFPGDTDRGGAGVPPGDDGATAAGTAVADDGSAGG